MSRFIQLSDIHFGAAVPAVVDALIRSIEELSPDGVLICGDYTMRARTREWLASVDFLKRIPFPTLSIPGNHDIPALNHPWHRLFHPFKRYKRYISEDLEPTMVIGDTEIVGINTARAWGAPSFNWSHGAVSLAQCAALPFKFQADTPFRAVMIHHPLSAPADQRRTLLRRDGLLLASMAKARVDVLLAGHFHQSYIKPLKLPASERDIVLSHVSTACSHRTKGEPQGFHVIETNAGSVSVTPHTYRAEKNAFIADPAQNFIPKSPGEGWSAN